MTRRRWVWVGHLIAVSKVKEEVSVWVNSRLMKALENGREKRMETKDCLTLLTVVLGGQGLSNAAFTSVLRFSE